MSDYEQFSPAQRAFMGYPHYATVSTVSQDGSPNLSIVWFDLDGESLVFTTQSDSLKARHMRQRPDIAMLINHGGRYVAVKGQAELVEDYSLGEEWLRRIALRYYGPEEGVNQFSHFNSHHDILVRLRPRKINTVGF